MSWGGRQPNKYSFKKRAYYAILYMHVDKLKKVLLPTIFDGI